MTTYTTKQLKQFRNHEVKLGLKSFVYKNLHGKYQSPAGFYDWNKILLGYAPFSEPEYLDVIRKSPEHSEAPISVAVGAIAAASLDAPAVYITRELTEALVRTDTTIEKSPELVLPCFFVCLPKGSFYTDRGSAITSLLIYTAEAVKTVIPQSIDTDRKASLMETVSSKKDNLYVTGVAEDYEIFSSITGWTECSGHDVDNDATAVCTALERIAKNVILIYNYQKNLITTHQPKAISKGFGERNTCKTRSPLPVTLLGQDFLVRRSSAASQDNAATVKNTKRPHWRKGHWHTTVCGAGRKERRLKWFQPVYVNAGLDA